MERKPQFKGDGVSHATINGHRFHLRLKDPIRDNFLWINGQQPPLVLDDTAADFVTFLIDAMWQHQQGDGNESEAVVAYVVEKMSRKYGRGFIPLKKGISKEVLTSDLNRLFGTLMNLAEGNCPADLGLDAKEIKYGDWAAPARMDLAVTYRCNLKCPKCYVGDSQTGPELGTADWLKVYEKIWNLGIPQVVFTGGEPTLRADIVELVSEADEFVTGLITNGTNLAGLADKFKKASLDYVQVTIESSNAGVHDSMTGVPGSHEKTVAGIKKALEVGLQVVTNTTLTKVNGRDFTKTIDWLAGLGIKNMACNSLICSGGGKQVKKENGLSDEELKAILKESCSIADKAGGNLQWYSPTCYNPGVNPLDLGLGIKACSAAAHNMTIQPDGTMLPCQSWPETVGNILTDPWNSIWKHPVCLKLRKHLMKPEACQLCEYVSLCGGGCPLDDSPRVAQKGEKGGAR